MNVPTFEAWRWGLLTNTMQPSVVAMVMLLMNLPQCGSSREAKLPPTRPCGAARRRCGFWPAHGVPATCGSRPKVPFRSVPQVFSLWGRSPLCLCGDGPLLGPGLLWGPISHPPESLQSHLWPSEGPVPTTGLDPEAEAMLWPAWSPTSLAGCDAPLHLILAPFSGSWLQALPTRE